MAPALLSAANRVLWYAVFSHILYFSVLVLHSQLSDRSRSISEFGFSEIELVLSVFLKQLWSANPNEVSGMFFHRLGSPTWRSMKLLQSLLTTMKCNEITDFTIPKEMHDYCLKAFYQNGVKQSAEWIVSTVLCFCASYPEAASSQQREELQLSLDLLSNILSWEWPKSSHYKYG